MTHLPKRDLFDILAQRQRVLRGREQTRWEQIQERMPSVDWRDLVFAVLTIATMAAPTIVMLTILRF